MNRRELLTTGASATVFMLPAFAERPLSIVMFHVWKLDVRIW